MAGAARSAPALQHPEEGGFRREDRGGGISAHYLRTGPADFGPGVQVRERQAGLRVWSRELAAGSSGFRLGADYAYTRYAFEGLPTRPRDLHHLFVPLQWRARDDRWLAVVTPVAAASSNVFKDFVDRGSGDDVDLHLRLQLEGWSRPDIGWRIALVRDTAFGAPRFYPAASLLWKTKRVVSELGVPSSRIDWQPRDRLALGAAVFPAGGSWHVISDERGGEAFDYRARAWRSALTADWRPRRWLQAGVQAGIEFRRRLEFEDDTGAVIDRKARPARYWRLELRLGAGG
jgi:hypothetical protein